MKVVITCGGKGTRLLPFSKELPKEMAPIFTEGENGVEVKPLLQQIFENLYSEGLRDFCFVTGKAKRSIEDHFSPDLTDKVPPRLSKFYEMLKNSRIMWINQLSPKGFGDAAYVARPYVNDTNFILHAGDVLILPKDKSPILKLVNYAHNNEVECVILLKNVDDPERHGIATIDTKSDGDAFQVKKVVEKPEHPETTLGIMPLYFFRDSIFTALEKITPGANNEIQLTDAIQKLIELGKKVLAFRVDEDTVLDVGTPESFWKALNFSHNLLPDEKKSF